MRSPPGLLLLLAVAACGGNEQEGRRPAAVPYVIVLGIAQDAGYPQAACRKACCARAWADPKLRRRTASLAIVSPATSERWIIDCTPDFREQLRALDEAAPPVPGSVLTGILLTHAHIGHYLGLVHLGREVMGVRGMPVFAMPRMTAFLRGQGPWGQLVDLKNIELRPLAESTPLALAKGITVTPLLVPHRDEYSETVAFVVAGPRRSVLYLPDIDKWDRWATPIEEVLARVDVAYVDGTFFSGDELPGRDMAEIPHPFITESIERFARLPGKERAKVRFLHLNHTNPALDPAGDAARRIREAGHRVAEEGERIELE